MSASSEVMAPFQPRPTPDSQQYWTNLRGGVVTARRCVTCRLWMHPPLERCRRCGDATEFEPLSGRGVVYSFTTTHYPVAPMYDSPFVVAVVDLEEQPGLRMVGRLVGVAPDDVRIGMAVVAEIEDLPGGSFSVTAFWPSPAPTV